MTLTEMLRVALSEDVKPTSQKEADAREYYRGEVKHTFKNWLKTVGLTDYTTLDRDSVPFSATESLRKLLILLVDEP